MWRIIEINYGSKLLFFWIFFGLFVCIELSAQEIDVQNDLKYVSNESVG